MDIQQKIKSFLNDKTNLLLLAILFFGLILRLKYLTINQAIWFDEGDYLSTAKGWAFGIPFQLHFVRPPLLPFLWTLFYKIGCDELTFRILQVLFSMVVLVLTYLTAKLIFNKYIGLIATTLMSFHYINLFYTARLLTEIPSLMFWLFTVYFFWRGYVREERKYIYWMGLTFAMAVLTRYPSGLLGGVFILYLLLTRDFKFLKVRQLWASVGIFIAVLAPFSIWFYLLYHQIPILGPAGFYHQEFVLKKALSFMPTILMSPIPYMSSAFQQTGNFFVLLLLAGLSIMVFNVVIGWDILKKDLTLKKQLFMLIWVFAVFAYFTFSPIVEDRYFFFIFPAFFIVIGWSMLEINKILIRYHKFLGIALIIVIVLLAGNYQLKYADHLIKLKADSFAQYKYGGLWIKANSNPGDKVMATGDPMVVYYSERQVVHFPSIEKETMEECLERERPKYYILSASERSADWTYSWPQEHPDKAIPVQAYYLDPEKTKLFLVIYQLKYE